MIEFYRLVSFHDYTHAHFFLIASHHVPLTIFLLNTNAWSFVVETIETAHSNTFFQAYSSISRSKWSHCQLIQVLRSCESANIRKRPNMTIACNSIAKNGAVNKREGIFTGFANKKNEISFEKVFISIKKALNSSLTKTKSN